MKFERQRGATGNMIVVFLMDSTSTTGAGKTGLTNASAGLNVSVRRELSSAVTAYTGANVNTITTLGTWADPTAGKCNFKEVDSTNQPGFYEVQFVDSLFGTSDASRFITGMVQATGVAPCPFEIELVGWNSQDGVRGGLTALPNVASGNAGAVITSGTGTAQLSVTSGVASANAVEVNGVSTSSVTAVNANVGTTQPVGFTGTGASALVKSDAVDIAGSAVNTGSAQIGVNVVNIAGQGAVLDGNNRLKVDCDDWGGTAITASSLPVGVPACAAGGVFVAGSNAATTVAGLTLSGANAVGGTPATAGLTVAGGAASTTAGGTSAPALKLTGGAGAASTNGASPGVSSTGGGTTTVSGADGMTLTGTGDGNGLGATGAGGGAGGSFLGGAAGAGLRLQGHGSHAAVDASATGTGPGVLISGGATSGEGVLVLTTNGSALSLSGTGVGNYDVDLTGSGTVHGSLTGDVQGKVLGGGVSALAGVGVQADLQTIKTQAVTCAGSVTVGAFVGNGTAAIAVSAGGKVSEVVLADTLTTYTGNTPQTGDCFARIGAGGAGLTAVGLDLTKAVPATGNTANSIGDCLNGARAQAFGAWKIAGTTLTMYASDGTTVVHTFTLDSATSPTQRV